MSHDNSNNYNKIKVEKPSLGKLIFKNKTGVLNIIQLMHSTHGFIDRHANPAVNDSFEDFHLEVIVDLYYAASML